MDFLGIGNLRSKPEPRDIAVATLDNSKSVRLPWLELGSLADLLPVRLCQLERVSVAGDGAVVRNFVTLGRDLTPMPVARVHCRGICTMIFEHLAAHAEWFPFDVTVVDGDVLEDEFCG